MLYNAHSLNVLTTIDTRYCDIGAHCFMLLNFLPNTLRFAMSISLALNRSKLAMVIMRGHLLVLEYLIASHGMVPAFKLHLL
jgi:hypothetical protein